MTFCYHQTLKGNCIIPLLSLPTYHLPFTLKSKTSTAIKVSKYGVFSGPNTEKYEPKKTLYMDTFHTVIFLPKTLVTSKRNGGIGRTELYVAVFDIGKATQVVEN